ncbi:MAG: UDP-N-acetylglucosamine diphosphorylase/glucosamine-1-phosphate N-acetyltransferase [Candidatus Sedimenticola endophacoides]|uniref:Bifunctional protein GlmU n=2 Tax=Candidatus Sedimenticola endophacoides TaxID=2548426 RepID=A0A6N4DMK0_9GAMM|nr:MAG: UDP-N-acetylglucosamine diphosphorylase/glucosamine-1-phosphate N-acetyltransferase [Candidatus Sedimenticola endophacoides]OQX37432.1 MAG: UDP-N-acetylglucosamine diphosphorylase/glucosamine-1-phosphate N-acetyltransferase [Candidatus Sedimenticola endophacoides]OQX39197.1 MAG: UDP-N-acetylglucosamine diphosphorylase/glucosamine-1-phosphate N-acetyltransferase [Candidatus Sedimenticola endophacoides]PUD98456.1 MAG: UDP-N-acetylglucosamine diphosphorylase/glucosamine-1-phosphate N-acetyl
MKLGVVILAAGKGTRMKSALPKVLHPLAGRPLVGHVIAVSRALGAERVAVVYGHGGEAVPEAIGDEELSWVEQAEQLGTGHAVEQAMPAMAGMDRVLVLYGDVPLIAEPTLRKLIAAAVDTDLALLTVELADPGGYGRIVRDADGRPRCIVEQKDADARVLAITEVNTGILVADGERLARWLGRLDNANAQGEFYLTDIVAMAVADGVRVHTAQPADPREVLGVNDRVQLAGLERHYQQNQAERLMRAGVTLRDPVRFDLRGSLDAGQDVEIDVNVLIEGTVRLGNRVRIGANTVLRDVTLGDGVVVRENCVLERALIGEQSIIGPFARIRPDTELGPRVHVGNFVEVKKSLVDEGSKINHLSYVGDSVVGKRVNIGAGVITCNYDGANKYRTTIGDDAFIGSDSQLVAPVEVEAGATIGAGSTITRTAPARQLTLSRSKQTTLKGWKRPVRDR